MRAQEHSVRKIRFNLSLDNDLAKFIKGYAKENRTKVADVITQYILALKRQVEGDPTAIIMSDPDFYAALKDAKKKLQAGTAKYQTFDEVFGK